MAASERNGPTDDHHWPALPLDGWRDTYATLHMWAQIVGKVALAQSPPINHSWGVAFHLTPRGWTTLTLPHGSRTFAIEFDFIDHQLVVRASDGQTRAIALRPRTVAEFYTLVMDALREMSLPVKIWPMAVELPQPFRLDRDVEHKSYDADAAQRYWRILSTLAPIFTAARARFVGKCSPVHIFFGALDLACTRFSGRAAPPRDGPAFMREAYSKEVISHGFWAGGEPVNEPVLYAYAVPEPEGLKEAAVLPAAAYYHREMGEFILPYEAVRTSADPAAAVASFIDSTYEQAATLAGWDRGALELS
jgi:hypothetical protein